MPGLFNLSLGGILISLVLDQDSGSYDLIKRAAEFQSTEEPEINLQVHCGWYPEMNDGLLVFDSEKGWKLSHSGNQRVIRVYSATQDPYQLGIYAADFRAGDIYVAPSEDTPGSFIFPLSYPMGELYTMNLLGTGLGMLFHAAGVIDRGKGYLFVGQSGAGKTTTARLWQGLEGVQVVNDDKVIIRNEAGGFRMYGTPWHGEGGMASPESAPLRNVFVLKQALQNSVTSLTPIQAASSLLGRAFIPLWDQEKMDFILKFLESLCQEIPCHELGFLPDSSSVEFIRRQE